MDMISRQDAIIALSHNKCGNDENDIAVQRDIETIKKTPLWPEAHWITHDAGGIEVYECSICHFMIEAFTNFNYCPNCGSKIKTVNN